MEALRIIKYLISTENEQLHMFDAEETETFYAFADSDCAEERETRKLMSGTICKVFGAAVSWSSR